MNQLKLVIGQFARSSKVLNSTWRSVLVAALIGLICFFASCKEEDPLPDGANVTITSIEPNSGPVGTVVTITGSGFTTPTGSNTVTVNGKAAEVNSATTTQLEVVVPAGATTGIVSVTVSGKKADGPIFTVTAVPVTLTITSATPLNGNAGTVVTINGSGFSTTLSQNLVKFNGIQATVQAATATQLTVTAPPATTGNISIVVGSATAAGPVFTYNPIAALTISGIAPNTGVPGTSVTITGTGFNSTAILNIVKFNGVLATVQSATGTQLVVFAPANAKTGSVTVEASSVVAAGPTFTYPTVATVMVFAGGTVGKTDGVGELAKFNNPAGLAFNSKGTLFVADRDNHAIREIAPDRTVKLYSGQIGFAGFLVGPRLNCLYRLPSGIAVDNEDNVFVANEGNHSISKIDIKVDISYQYAGGGGNPNSPAYGFADASGQAARFKFPTGLSIDRFNNLYVADQGNNSVRKITAVLSAVTPTGAVTTLAGSPTTAVFNGPTGVFVKDLTVLVADKDGKLKLIDGANVKDITTINGSISSVAEDSKGNKFVVSNSSNVLSKITSAGVQSSIAAAPNGIPLNKPFGIAIDKFDNIYISDSGNNRIIKITLP